ncbi:MAG: hypothetical protein AAGA30_05610 [Planctomycetota bacterium]
MLPGKLKITFLGKFVGVYIAIWPFNLVHGQTQSGSQAPSADYYSRPDLRQAGLDGQVQQNRLARSPRPSQTQVIQRYNQMVSQNQHRNQQHENINRSSIATQMAQPAAQTNQTNFNSRENWQPFSPSFTGGPPNPFRSQLPSRLPSRIPSSHPGSHLSSSSNVNQSAKQPSHAVPNRRNQSRTIQQPVYLDASPSQPVRVGPRRTAPIPVKSTDDRSKVTRARILLVQDDEDPFGQEPVPDQAGSGNRNRDPFSDPPVLDQFESNQDPFDTLPSDLAPEQNAQDPFSNPPSVQESPVQPQPTQDPFGQQPNKINEVDPTPINPQNIRPSDDLDLPAEPPVNPRETIPPSLDPSRIEEPADRNPPVELNKVEDKPKGPTGPYSQPGFTPTPIKPEPAFRDNMQYLAPPIAPINEIPIMGGPQSYDQPNLMIDGFEKAELYEGITQGDHSSIPSTYPDEYYQQPTPQNECISCPKPSLIDRWFPDRSCWNPAGVNCSSCASDCGAGCGCDYGGYRFDECFEPMFYFAILGGYTQLENSNRFSDSSVPGLGGVLEFDDGYALGFALGQIQGKNLRLELEFVYRSNDVDRFINNDLTGFDVLLEGSEESYSGMFNVFWDFSRWPNWYSIQPYVGGGVGFSLFETTLLDQGNDIVGASGANDSSFAYQLMFGLTKPMSQNTDAFLEYRYFAADEIPVTLNVLGGAPRSDFANETDNIFFGIRVHY